MLSLIVGVLLIIGAIAWAVLVYFANGMSDVPDSSPSVSDFFFSVILLGVGLLLIFG